MNKIKYFAFVLLALALAISCEDDNNQQQQKPFDYEGQAKKDKDTISKFLKNFYFDDEIDSIKPFVKGKTSLSEDKRLVKIDVNEFGIDYSYYYFVINEGKSSKNNPTVADSVLVDYSLKKITKSTSLENIQTLKVASWFSPRSIAVRGWLYGFTHFKGGVLNPYDGKNQISYTDIGSGFFILPSGLAYRKSSDNLIYYVNMYDLVENTDSDNDGVPSIKEDINGDGKPWNDDTDGDGVANYIDRDDDNDGVLTKQEDRNGNGDPTDDFNDPKKPTTPDYLNFKVR